MRKISAKKLEVWIKKELAHYQNIPIDDIEKGQHEALQVVQEAFENGEFDVKGD